MEAYINPFCDTMINDNLLDNAYFLNPVNQRGQTEYTQGYTIDRWYRVRGTVRVESDGLHVIVESGNSCIEQYFDPLTFKGKTLTLSVLSNGKLASATVSFQNNDEREDVTINLDVGNIERLAFWKNYNSKYDAISIYTVENKDTQITAAKLEIGTQQTLAHQENGLWVLNEIPNYQQELAKCQRHQLRILESNTAYGGAFGFGFANGANTARITVPVPVTMRAKPAAVFLNGDATNIQIIGSSGDHMVSSIDSVILMNHSVAFIFNVSGVVNGEPVTAKFTNSANMLLDANL